MSIWPLVLPAIGRARDGAQKEDSKTKEDKKQKVDEEVVIISAPPKEKEDRKPKLIPEYQFKMQSIALKNELSPHMQDGPMDMKEFWQIIRKKPERDNPHLILFTIIRLGEPALAIEYMDSLPNVKDILNAPIPTKDRWLIHRACWEGCVPLLEAMIERGVSSDRLNSYSESPFGVVEQSVEQGIYGRDQAEKIKALLKRANAAPPPPPPRSVAKPPITPEVTESKSVPPRPLPAPPTLPLPSATPSALPTSTPSVPPLNLVPPILPTLSLSSLLPLRTTPLLPMGASLQEMLENLQKMRAGAWPLAPIQAPPVVEEDTSWILGLQSSADQTHVYVSQIAFEVTPEELKSVFEKCGPIEKLHMPVKRLRKQDSFQRVATKIQDAGHQGKAVIKFSGKDSVVRALTFSGENIKGRTILVARTRKSVKRKQKTEAEMTLTEKLLGKYAKKKRRAVTSDKEKAPKGDIAWLDNLVAGPDQTHCFVNGIAFEAPVAEVKKMFKKCGELVGFYMPPPKVEGKGRFNHVKTRTEHRGTAIVMFRTLYGLRAALALNNTVLHGRQIAISKTRRTLKESNVAQLKRDQKKRKVQETEDAKAQIIPSDVDNKEPLDKEQIEAKAWTEKVMKQVNLKLAQEAARAAGIPTKKRRRTEVAVPTALEPQDEFTLMLLAFKKTRAAMQAKDSLPIGPEKPDQANTSVISAETSSDSHPNPES